MTGSPRRPGDRFGTAQEVADHYRMSLRTVRQLIADGVLPVNRIAGTNRIIRIDWDEADRALSNPTPTELDAQSCGLIAAALEAYAEDHPDQATADQCTELAEQVTTHRVLLAEQDR